jgi:hypothetical protein
LSRLIDGTTTVGELANYAKQLGISVSDLLRSGDSLLSRLIDGDGTTTVVELANYERE